MARLTGFAVLAFLAVPAPAMAQRLGGGGDLNLSLTRVVMALLFCLMLAGVAALLLKRGGGKLDIAAVRRMFVTLPARRRIQVIETRRMSQYADLCLLRCDGQEYLILSAAQQQTVLRETPVAEPAS